MARQIARRAIVRAPVCAWLLALSAGPVVVSAAEPPMSAAAAVRRDLVDFDLPAQPLSAALDAYAVVTGQNVLFSDALVEGRVSAPVSGRHPPRDALAALLSGTGLVADDPDGRLGGAFVLRRIAQPATETAALAPHFDRRYDGLLQYRVWQALCAQPRTAPGRYRAALRISVGQDGRLADTRLLSSTGDSARDRAVLAALDGLPLDLPPPDDLPQPLVLVILPGDRVAGRACVAEAAP